MSVVRWQQARVGAPVHVASRLVVARPHGQPLRVLYTVDGWHHRVPPFQIWLDNIETQLPPNAVSEIDVHTFYDDATPDDGGRNVLACVNASVPLGPHERAENVWGNHVLLQESWDYLGGERERIIARARAMARGLGLDDMSDPALYDTVVQKRASLNRDNAAALAANAAVHARLVGVAHEDFTLRRSDFGLGGVRQMRVRVYILQTVLMASEVRAATSDGQQRALWACNVLPGASRQAERVAILYAAPLPFRRCFLQRVSPPLSEFAVLLRNFPWLPLGTSCRDAISFFDRASQTDGFDAAAKFVAWQNVGGAARAALVQRRAAACEARVRRQLARVARGGGHGLGGAHGAPGAEASSGEDFPIPSATPPPGAAAAVADEGPEGRVSSPGVTSPSATPSDAATGGVAVVFDSANEVTSPDDESEGGSDTDTPRDDDEAALWLASQDP